MKHTLKEWFFATRPWSYPASIVPVIVSLCFLYSEEIRIDWLLGLATVVNAALFHAAANLWSDLHDYKYGVDTPEGYGPKTLTGKQFEYSEIKAFSISLFAIAILMGITLVMLTRIELLWVGIIGAALSLLYPLMKFNALGDLNIFMNFCVLPSVGTSIIAAGEIHWPVIFAALPVGLIVVAILHANNTRDIAQDQVASIRTYAMVVGEKASYWTYWLEVVFLPYALIAVLAGASVFTPWTLIAFATLPIAMSNSGQFHAMVFKGQGNINNLDEKTAQLSLALGVAMSASFILSRFI